MFIGVSSYSFSRLMQQGQMDVLDVVAQTATMGFDAIEFAGLPAPDGETALGFAPRVREACARVGLPVVSYTVGADFLHGAGGDWRAEAQRLHEEVRVAHALGAPCMRHDATRGFLREHHGPRGFDDALPILIEGCRAVTEYAADFGIRTTVENHGFFCQDSERVERLMNGVGHSNFGALIDIGNFLCADENPATAVGRLAPYAFHVHVKDFHVKSGTALAPGKGWFSSRGGSHLRGAIIGHGEVPVAQCLRLLQQAGYDGAISIEFEGLEEPLTGIRIGLENLRRYVGELAPR